MTNKTPWTDSENTALLALYFEMLDYAIPAKQYSKAGLIRIAQSSGQNVGIPCSFHGQLADRSRGSIEFKLMNATAAHRDLGGAITMDGYGYRAMPNYQATLKQAMLAELQARDNRLAKAQGA